MFLLMIDYTVYVVCALSVGYVYFFFFNQKTAYEMRISDWSSDVCSSDLAGLFPAIFKALGLDGHIAEVSRQAGSFKNLQDKFRFLAESSHLIIDEERSVKFQQLMDEMNELRMHSTTPPERFFTAAQKKVKSGHYEFGGDQSRK